jgi:hypothetical protein
MLFISCEERNYYTNSNASLWFTSDTISFDTVFTTIGSATLNFRVHNPYKDDLEINSISLEGGAASDFRINIDGAQGLGVTDKLLRAEDSMYIFVDVNVNPRDSTLPFLLEDYIIFNTNGKKQKVLLQAYGQDAYHIKLGEWGDIGKSISISDDGDTTYTSLVVLNNDTTLKADKPYYLHNSFYVSEGVELILEAGVRFYIEKDKNIYIGGSIKSNGTVDAPVVFRGHRLDNLFPNTPYDKVAGQWGVIALQKSSYDNEFTHTHIRNGLTGLYVDSLSNNDHPKALLKNCRIENMTSAALYGLEGEVIAENTLFANCEQRLFAASAGGSYEFTNCTFANYYNAPDGTTHKVASVVLSNHDNTYQPYDLQKADFTNCIIDGTISNELSLSNLEDEEGSVAFKYNFDHCLITTNFNGIDSSDARFDEVLWNKYPLFIAPTEDWNFHPDTLSAVIDRGISTHLTSDINEINYIGAPDLGAFEFAGASE